MGKKSGAHYDRPMAVREGHTARELAERFGCDTDTITRHANRLFGKGGGQGKKRFFNAAQTTAILESLKNAAETGRKIADSAASENIIGSMETSLSKEFRLAMLYKRDAELMKEAASLERELRITAETKLLETETAFGREVLDHRGTKAILAERETGLGMIQRIAEAGGLLVSDCEDMLNTYRREKE